MPFKSEAQRKFLFARHPKIAEKFAKETPKGKRLPKHVASNKHKSGRGKFQRKKKVDK